MSRNGRLRKVVDEEADIRCVSGPGLVREEVWATSDQRVARYNLAFICHFLHRGDNGRVLGYDASHGYHHRHFKGTTEPFDFVSYEATRARFIAEVRVLRQEER